jgi:hypothetical protein
MTPPAIRTAPRHPDRREDRRMDRRMDRRTDRGTLLLEAIFALFLLGVVALGTLGLLAHSLTHFGLAEARGRALPVAGAWLDAAAAGEMDTTAVEAVGPGELRWGRGPEGTGLPRLEFVHLRGGRWPLPTVPGVLSGEEGWAAEGASAAGDGSAAEGGP